MEMTEFKYIKDKPIIMVEEIVYFEIAYQLKRIADRLDEKINVQQAK